MQRFQNALEFWSKETQARLLKANRQAGQHWVAEAKKRVPVDEGRLRSSLRTNTYVGSDGLVVTEVGSNLDYAPHIEFGTENIAGGRVKALGLSPNITDAQAIFDWPAKTGEATPATALKMDSSGRLRTATGQYASQPQEQMPFLRTAFMKIRLSIIDRFNAAIAPPKQVN